MARNAERIVLAMIFAAGCSSSTGLPDLVPSTSPIDVSVHQVSLPEGERLRWSLATQEILPCSNFGIATRTYLLSDPWVVHVDGIQEGPLCDNALGPARTQLDLGPARTGSHRFHVVLPEGIGLGTMRVTEDSIFVDYSGPRLHFVDTAVPRVPRVKF